MRNEGNVCLSIKTENNYHVSWVYIKNIKIKNNKINFSFFPNIEIKCFWCANKYEKKEKIEAYGKKR